MCRLIVLILCLILSNLVSCLLTLLMINNAKFCHAEILIPFFFLAMPCSMWGPKFSNQGLNLHPLHWTAIKVPRIFNFDVRNMLDYFFLHPFALAFMASRFQVFLRKALSIPNIKKVVCYRFFSNILFFLMLGSSIN